MNDQVNCANRISIYKMDYYIPRKSSTPPQINLPERSYFNQSIHSINPNQDADLTQSTEINYPLVKIFKILFTLMNAVGLTLLNLNSFNCATLNYINTFTISIIFVIFSLLHNLIVLIVLINSRSANLFYHLFSIIKLCGGLSILVYFKKHESLITDLFLTINNIFSTLNQGKKFILTSAIKLRQLICLNIIILICLSLAYIIVNIQRYTKPEAIQVYFDTYFFGLNVSSIDKYILTILIIINNIFYFWASLVPLHFFATYYVLICRLTEILFNYINNRLNQLVDKIHLHSNPLECVVQFRQIHNQLTKLVKIIDERLSFMLLIVLVLMISDLSKYIYLIADKLTKPWQGTLEIIFVFTRVFHVIWIIISTSLAASYVTESSIYALDDLQNLSTRMERISTGNNVPNLTNSTLIVNNLTAHMQLLGLIIKLQVSPSHLTGWKLFLINKPFILTVIGVCFTYSLLLIQLTPHHDLSSQANQTGFS